MVEVIFLDPYDSLETIWGPTGASIKIHIKIRVNIYYIIYEP